MKVLEKQLTVHNRQGVHGRIATDLVKIAYQFGVKFYITYDGKVHDCLSVLDILSIALVHGATFDLKIIGARNSDALAAVEKLIGSSDGA